MTLLAPTLAASSYLDKTEQWSLLPPETKDRAPWISHPERF